MGDPSGGITWLPWGREAFARAQADEAPILLAIGASWCRWCSEMSRTTYRDPAVRQLIDRRFVPVWVDAARRPDVNERYNLGGWPTTAFLTPPAPTAWMRPRARLRRSSSTREAAPSPTGTPSLEDT